MPTYNTFNVKQVELAGTNLIEASAGTGKTYSIALLVLRLVLEKNVPVNRILMVTFTKAAVAELESRIRLFIRLAQRASNGKKIAEKSIAEIVQGAIQENSAEQVNKILQESILLLDELSVQTIHSFCQESLEEFALEANMGYNPEIVTDSSDSIDLLVNDFWRSKITTLPVNILKEVINDLDKATIVQGVKDHLEEKVTYGYNPEADYGISDEILREIENEMASGDEEQAKQSIRKLTENLKFGAINEILPRIKSYKEERNLLTYDDMIQKMHDALTNGNDSAFKDQLQKKYEAVFIDEFQDTDKLQYEIFKSGFHSRDSLIFYIGDPKQSIYSWRKADINTYLKASREVDNLYGMNFNFRSSERMIQAMNDFFLPEEGFDTFAYGHDGNDITYKRVDSPNPNSKGILKHNNRETNPISIFEVEKKDHAIAPVVAQVAALLNGKDYKIEKEASTRNLVPGDIGILVRTNPQAQQIKEALSRVSIPAVTIGDTKVFDSSEASYLLYLLEAFEHLSQGTINKALLSPFTGLDLKQILELDNDQLAEIFRKYRNIWRQSGIMPAIKTFIADFNVRGILLSQETEQGERIIANLYHLTELVHKAESTKRLSPAELINWLHSAIKDSSPAVDEYEQRIENDENAVNIITIHKSKGLQYNVVITPYLDLITYTPFNDISWRDPDSGTYITGNKKAVGAAEKNLHDDQVNQENRRLLYVAITRSVYKCFIIKVNTKTGPFNTKNSALAAFTNALKNNPNTGISFEECPILAKGYFYSDSAAEKPVYSVAKNFELTQTNWRKMSYSFLAADHEYHPKTELGKYPTDYDRFVFSDLVKGPKTGDMLHFIFENIDFTDDTHWDKIIREALTQYLPKYKAEYAPLLRQMVSEILNSRININGNEITLSSIENAKRINELEFDFTVPLFNPKRLESLAPDGQIFSVGHNHDMEGMMNGKIDLFFEHNGRYYILDWKSNFLGDSLDCYTPEKLNESMNENNYHLQHLIYASAIDLYLKSRIPDYDAMKHFGGVIYVFLRGVRKDSESGIFTTMPDNTFAEVLKC
ncbi:UvrD-helicase domain-containing protein [Marinilabiliaceae bacterium ANBcel2]|nr:UvrD-helicase domain-containing protein [Marinilabiliaceae bacterium ANBcel2]